MNDKLHQKQEVGVKTIHPKGDFSRLSISHNVFLCLTGVHEQLQKGYKKTRNL